MLQLSARLGKRCYIAINDDCRFTPVVAVEDDEHHYSFCRTHYDRLQRGLLVTNPFAAEAATLLPPLAAIEARPANVRTLRSLP